MIKGIINRILYGQCANSSVYIKYLKKQGCNIGDNVYFFEASTCRIDVAYADYITIGNGTTFAAGFRILAHDYSPSVLVKPYKQLLLPGGNYVSIGNNCFFGADSTVLMGTAIGDNVIIGYGSVITKDVQSNVVCAGRPAKVIMTLEEYRNKRLDSYIIDAKRNVKQFFLTNQRFPTIRECHGFAMLFIDRTEENYKMYFEHYNLPGNNKEDIKKAFFSTEKKYENFDEFIKSIDF